MSRLRTMSITLLFSSTLLILTLLTTAASQSSYLDVKPYTPPNIDGTVSANEYPSVLAEGENFKLYASENGSYVFFSAIVKDSSQDQRRDNVSLAFDIYNDQSSELKTDDLLLTVCRDGFVASYYGASSRWIAFSTPAGILLKTSSLEDKWSFDLAIPYQELSIYKGRPKTLGFALFQGNGGTISSLFPTNANYLSPYNWSSLNSSASWGVPDISIGVKLSTDRPRTNETVKFSIKYRNEGDSEVFGVTVNMSVEDKLVDSRFDNLSIKPGDEREMIFNWTAASAGSYRVKFEAVSAGFDANVNNNIWKQTIEISDISLVFRGPDGVIVYVDEYNGTITDGEVHFLIPYGQRRLNCSTVLGVEPGVELRFVNWRLADKEIKNSSITLLVDDDLTISVDFLRWFRVSFTFLDAHRRPLVVENYTVIFDDQSTLVASEPLLWVEDGGRLRVVKVCWEGVEVLRDEIVRTVRSPANVEVPCKVYDLTLNVIDPIGLPLSRAKVEVKFVNGTRAVFETDDSGVLKIPQVPLGRVEGNISSIGFTQSFSADAPLTKIMTRFSGYVLVIFLVPILAVLSMVAIFVVKGRTRRKAKAEEKRDLSPFEL